MHPSVFLTADPIQGYEERCSLSRVSPGERDRLPVYHQTNFTHLKKKQKNKNQMIGYFLYITYTGPLDWFIITDDDRLVLWNRLRNQTVVFSQSLLHPSLKMLHQIRSILVEVFFSCEP